MTLCVSSGNRYRYIREASRAHRGRRRLAKLTLPKGCGLSESQWRPFNIFAACATLVQTLCPDAGPADIQAMVGESFDRGPGHVVTLFVRDLENSSGKQTPREKVDEMRRAVETAEVSPAQVQIPTKSATYSNLKPTAIPT